MFNVYSILHSTVHMKGKSTTTIYKNLFISVFIRTFLQSQLNAELCCEGCRFAVFNSVDERSSSKDGTQASVEAQGLLLAWIHLALQASELKCITHPESTQIKCTALF